MGRSRLRVDRAHDANISTLECCAEESCGSPTSFVFFLWFSRCSRFRAGTMSYTWNAQRVSTVQGSSRARQPRPGQLTDAMQKYSMKTASVLMASVAQMATRVDAVAIKEMVRGPRSLQSRSILRIRAFRAGMDGRLRQIGTTER